MKRDWPFVSLPVAALLFVGLQSWPQAAAADAVGQLKAEILSSSSATQTLTAYCARLRLADPPVIRAVRDRGADRKADAAMRRLLEIGVREPVRYRRVRLACGSHVLSDADNWYVPARLTAEMNRKLDGSDTPFGTVVKPLHFQRRTLRTALLHDRGHVLQVTALLVDGAGKPFSLVQESYSRELIRDGYP